MPARKFLDNSGLSEVWSKAKAQGNKYDIIIVNNVTSSAWSSDNTYADYQYRATLSVTGMTANHMPEVVFDGTDSDVEKIAQHCVSYNGGVYIYASADIGTVTANTVKGVKVVSN